MKIEKYEYESKKKRKTILIIISVIVLVSVSLLLYKTFASFSEEVEFPMMKGQVDYFGNSDVYFAFYNGNDKLDIMPLKDNDKNLVFDYGECDNGASIEWDSEEWAPLVKNLSKSKTKCSLYFRKYNAADYIKDLSKTDTTNLKTDDTSEANIRYVGATPNNYMDIGDRDSEGNPILWRIIGVMNKIVNLDNDERKESLVKVIRADSIGKYSWDTSEYSVNEGNGVNEWSQADAMKLLNPNTVYSGTPTIGGSLYWSRGSGNCYVEAREKNELCDFTNNGISEEAKEKIAKVRWNTGTSEEEFDYNKEKYTAKYIYEKERSNHNGKELCDGSSKCNDNVERTTIWDGYIGLMYPSDFGYAVGGEVREKCLGKTIQEYDKESCNTNDWLTPSDDNAWTITPMMRTISNRSLTIFSSGFVYSYDSRCAYGIYPTAYLKLSTKILSNPKPELEYGSIDNPFVLES